MVIKFVEDGSQAAGRDVERRERDRQSEAPRARASGIQVEHAPERFHLRCMGMAGDYYVDAERDGIDPQGLEIVHDENGPAAEANEFGVGIFAGPVAGIHVSPYCRDRRDPPKRNDDFGTSDIAAVNDVIHASQTALRFRSQQAVGVRDDADGERHRCTT